MSLRGLVSGLAVYGLVAWLAAAAVDVAMGDEPADQGECGEEPAPLTGAAARALEARRARLSAGDSGGDITL